MNSTSDSHDKLERLVGRVLRDQPLRRAPAALESRVLAALERSGARRGWRKGFTYWPLAARAAFILVSIGFVKSALLAVEWVLRAIDSSPVAMEVASNVEWVRVVTQSVVAAVRSIPEEWVWAIAALIIGIYTLFFAISAIAYRALYASR
jgi:hypothetical protein